MATDIILNKITRDIEIINGDFSIGESSQQETDLLLNSFVGNWFEFPLVGIGIISYLAGSASALFIENVIKQQMITDGFTVDSVSIKGSTLNSPHINIEA